MFFLLKSAKFTSYLYTLLFELLLTVGYINNTCVRG